jgi:uncharacterized protein YndB with AHSA1/START domain
MQFTISVTINAPARTIYKAWLSGKEHSKMTGGRATGSARVNGRFTAWDDYVSGRNVELRPSKLIRQAWRTTEFKSGQEDSILQIKLIPKGKNKTKLILTHSNLTKSDLHYKHGWREHYFQPMKEYFG